MSGILISPGYLDIQRQMHETTPYGGRGDRWAAMLLSMVYAIAGREPEISILDYGAGKGALKRALTIAAPTIDCREYDPAVPGKSQMPAPADIVSCTDVLEHIEPDCIDAVLAHMRSLTIRPAMFLVIALQATTKTLPDGRGAHVLVRPADWWQSKLVAHGWRVRELEAASINRAKHLAAYCSRP